MFIMIFISKQGKGEGGTCTYYILVRTLEREKDILFNTDIGRGGAPKFKISIGYDDI